MSDEDNGKAPPPFELLPGGKREAPQDADGMADYIEQMLPTVGVYGPHFPPEAYDQLARFLANQQRELNEHVVFEMMDPDTPYKCIEMIVGKGKAGDGEEAVFPAYKQIVTVEKPMHVFPMPLMHSILTNPVSRAIFYMNGWQVRFRQRRDNPMDPQGPKIIL